MKKATRQALRITGATGGGVGGAPSTATFGVRQAGSTFARQSAHFLGRSAMGIGAGTAGSTVASVVIGVAAIIVAIAIIYYFWQQRQQAKNNPQKVQEINQEEQRALNDLREVEKDAMRRPFEYFPTPGRAG